MRVLAFQVDGNLPNFALMRLAAWHRAKGDEVFNTRSIGDTNFYKADVIYASSIFTFSKPKRDVFISRFPSAIVGGDGFRPIWNNLNIIGKNIGSNLREVITDIDPEQIFPDYSDYPNFRDSIGYTQRGCRLDCAFCRMKTREGEARSVRTIRQLWRGEPHPKNIHLLDNDFFGQSEWRERLEEAREGGFRICFNQGINIRLINEQQAALLAKVGYWDDSFKHKRLYTAWDNLGDEKIFKKGIETLSSAGISPKHLMVYMLVGFRKGETMDEVFHRFNELISIGCHPYPMVFDNSNKELKRFQRWVIRRYYEFIPWKQFCGIEIEEKYSEIAAKRLAQKVLQF